MCSHVSGTRSYPEKWLTGWYGQIPGNYGWIGMGPNIATHTRKLGNFLGNGYSGMIGCGTLNVAMDLSLDLEAIGVKTK
jgi:hypothetical protein